MPKTVVMLIGPKGSGKTHIGTVLEKRAGLKFLRVEMIWLRLGEGQDGWQAVEEAVDSCLERSDSVVIESLGVTEGFERMRASLGRRYRIRYVRVAAPPAVCLERVRGRDSRDHIAVSDEKVEEYNSIAVKVALPWDGEICNFPPLTDREILAAVRDIL
jgi:shikimate kinase